MAAVQLDIERIVREVLLRLQQQGPSAGERAAVNGEAQQPRDSEGSGQRPGASEEREPVRVADPVPSSCLELTDRVVTLESLPDRLSGIRNVRVATGSVVTPSVRDELRKRGIKLQRAAAGAKPSVGAERTPPQLLLAAVTRSFDPGPLLRAVAAEFPAGEPILSECVFQATNQLVDQVLNSRQAAVLLTARPATAVCLANRQPGIRAAWVWDQDSLREAVDGIGANLLVIHPKKHSRFELLKIVRSFARADHVCPEGVKQFLSG
jgi:hypothetical protein